MLQSDSLSLPSPLTHTQTVGKDLVISIPLPLTLPCADEVEMPGNRKLRLMADPIPVPGQKEVCVLGDMVLVLH